MSRRTNTEVVTDLMGFARSGPLMQAFVLEAISRYAKQVQAADPRLLDSPFLSGAAWQACADEAVAAINKHLGAAP
ncbi:hypothetical protein [Xylophilus sp.]|uniref:hypothetical protein n=1 Tax=Xylophilus sp. TaxID=2653893 RepID=UPI0013BDEB1A|nr:hypothetical protein [Xylophilus sp.]KAF1049307.1 MAG: hypothetical protein GAK38_00763 [Xylophilus sp.]